MNKDKLDIEKLLYEQLPKIEEKMLYELPCDEDINYEFSSKFENKMDKLIRNNKKVFYKNFKKIVVICLIILGSLATITTIKTEAFPESLMRIMKKVYKEFTDYNFINPKSSSSSFEYIEPKYISPNYKEIERVKEKSYLSISYKDKSDNYIIYQMMSMGRTIVNLDTEDAFVESIEFNNHYAQYVEKENTQQLLWHDSNNIYMLSKEVQTKKITKKDKKEFIKIAKSIG